MKRDRGKQNKAINNEMCDCGNTTAADEYMRWEEVRRCGGQISGTKKHDSQMDKGNQI